VQRALLEGQPETGVTVQYIAEELDSGDVILQRRVPIAPEDDAGCLFTKLQEAGVPALSEALHLIERGEAPRQPQEAARATYAPLLTPDEAAVDWSQPAERIVNQIRAFSPHPAAYCHYRQLRVKLFVPEVVACPAEERKPGEIVNLPPQGLVVRAGRDCVLVREVQPAGKRRMPATDLARGARLVVGMAFTDG
jgi:methionyl-tRNA formyltransferase